MTGSNGLGWKSGMGEQFQQEALQEPFWEDESGSKEKFQFQYNPSSCALNFDDGLNNMGEEANAFHKAKFQCFPEITC